MMSKSKLLGLALILGALAGPAMADTLKLVSTGGTVVDNDYIYPYNFSIDGSSTLTPLMCIDYNLHTTQGETWNVVEESIPTDSSTQSTDLRALALIDWAAATGYDNLSISDLQFADWSILDPQDVDGLSGFTPTASYIAQVALEEATDTSLIDTGFFSGFTLYAVDTSNQSGWTDNQPQDFIGDIPAPVSPTPEPSSIALLGTGMLAVSQAVRRMKRQA